MVEELDGRADGEGDVDVEDDDARGEGGGERDERGGRAEDEALREVDGVDVGEVEGCAAACGGPGDAFFVDLDC